MAMLGPIGGILGYYFASRVEKLAEATVVYGEDQTWNQGQRNSLLMTILSCRHRSSRQTARPLHRSWPP